MTLLDGLLSPGAVACMYMAGSVATPSTTTCVTHFPKYPVGGSALPSHVLRFPWDHVAEQERKGV